jgi:hypothetical protein
VKEIRLIVAGLAAIVVLNVLLVLVRPHSVRTEHITVNETTVALP